MMIFLIETFSFGSLSGLYLHGCILPAIMLLNIIVGSEMEDTPK
jgi:hypothetical protein